MMVFLLKIVLIAVSPNNRYDMFMTIEQQIEEALDKIRPFIIRDGGNVEFDSFVDGIVYLRMEGACSSCGLIDSTMSGGLEVILMEEVPGVLAVKLASEKPQALPQELQLK
jgi:Fe-S cluster biogenesis protein NfuA